MKLVEKHLILVATEAHGISEIEFRDKGRWESRWDDGCRQR